MTHPVLANEPLTELETLVRQGMAGDQRVLPALRTLLDTRPDLWQAIDTLADRVRQVWLQRLTGTDLVAQEILTRQLQAMEEALAGPYATSLERLLVERIALVWLQVQQADLTAALVDAGEEHRRRLSRAVHTAAKGNGIAEDAGEDPRPGLLTLARRLRGREVLAFTRLQAEWLDGAGEEFSEAVTELGKRIAHRPSCVAEIERKFLLRQVPTTARQMPSIEIEQGWLPGTRLVERVSQWREDHLEVRYRTVKPGTGPDADEVEEATARGLFEDVWPLTRGRRVLKRRQEVPDYGLTWGIEQFLDRDLVLAQVQLAGEEPALPVPEWLEPYVVREVTGEREYSNRALAR